MNKNPKEKTAWISVRAKPKDKERIKNLAKRCSLSVLYIYFTAIGLLNLLTIKEPEKIMKEVEEKHRNKRKAGA